MVKSHKVIIPDLPCHAASKIYDHKLDPSNIYSWLNALIESTCEEPPALVGHVLGGAIAARYAIAQEEMLSKLVLVDSLGLSKFRPSLRFAFGLMRFMFQSTEKNYNRFLPQCLYDMEVLKRQMGEKWKYFIAYNLECSNDPNHKDATQKLMKNLGMPRIPSKDLENIRIPTVLIWGRHDRANQLKIAQAASKKYGWPLYVIEQARDDPKLEQPERFVKILRKILA
jgi:pimeloyl-ACP methyl ester carboxylesterase